MGRAEAAGRLDEGELQVGVESYPSGLFWTDGGFIWEVWEWEGLSNCSVYFVAIWLLTRQWRADRQYVVAELLRCTCMLAIAIRVL